MVVVNSPGLAGVPVEVLFDSPPRGSAAGPAPVVAYAPSASMLVHLARKARSADRPAALLALGDPAYPEPKPGQDKAPAKDAASAPKGLRVFVCGHSLHWYIPTPLGELAKAAGIEGVAVDIEPGHAIEEAQPAEVHHLTPAFDALQLRHQVNAWQLLDVP